jgi:RimJ/RimL family protein N-acetyltransferase
MARRIPVKSPALPLETPRLMLRRFRAGDLKPFLAYRQDPEIARFQSWENYTQAQAKVFLSGQRKLSPGQPGKWVQFALEERATGALIGDCALKVEGGTHPQGELGFTLSRAAQSRGFAVEAVTGLLDFAFRRLRLHRVTALTDCRNLPAAKLLQRLGFHREGHFLRSGFFKGEWCDEYLFAMLESEWVMSRD